MPDPEVYQAVIALSCMFAALYGLAGYYCNGFRGESLAHEVLKTMPFVTQSAGLVWGLSAFFLLSSFIFQGVFGAQGIEAPEIPIFNRAVLTYAGWLTLLFSSPLIGAGVGARIRVYRGCRLERKDVG